MASSTDFSNRLRNASRGSPPALPMPIALINSCSTVMFSPFVKLSIVIRQQQRPTLALHRLARPDQSPTLRLALLLAGHFTRRSQTTFPHWQGQRAALHGCRRRTGGHGWAGAGPSWPGVCPADRTCTNANDGGPTLLNRILLNA